MAEKQFVSTPQADYLTVKDVQAILHLSKAAVYNLAKNKLITTIRGNGIKILFPRTDLEAFIRRNTVPAKRQHLNSHSQSPDTL